MNGHSRRSCASFLLDSPFASERCSRVALTAPHIADTGEPALGIRRRQIDTLSTGSTPSTESTIVPSQTNSGTTLVTVASPTTTQEISSFVVDMSSPTVVVSILIEIVAVLAATSTQAGASPMPTATATGTNTSPAAGTSSPVPSNGLPPLPPLLQWFQWAVVTIYVVASCIYLGQYLVRRKKAQSRQEHSCQADIPGAFDGCGRTCKSKGSWLLGRWRNFVAMMNRLLCREKSPRCRQTILPPET